MRKNITVSRKGPAAGTLTKREKKRYLELQHGIERGQKIKVTAMEPSKEEHGGTVKATHTYKIIDVYPHCVLIENEKGIRNCPPYARLNAMLQGREG